MSETAQQVPARPRAFQDPATLVWAITSVGWAVCLLLIVTGGMAAGHHDTVLSRPTEAWPGQLLLFAGV